MNNFSVDVNKAVNARLKLDNPSAKESAGKLNGLKCTVCGKAEAFAYSDSPMAIICHRNNQCGATTPTKKIYPELWQNLAKKYPPTPNDRKATARAYLESRGLNPELIEFDQGVVDGHQTLIIKQDDVVFQRLIDYTGKDKARLTAYKYLSKINLTF